MNSDERCDVIRASKGKGVPVRRPQEMSTFHRAQVYQMTILPNWRIQGLKDKYKDKLIRLCSLNDDWDWRSRMNASNVFLSSSTFQSSTNPLPFPLFATRAHTITFYLSLSHSQVHVCYHTYTHTDTHTHNSQIVTRKVLVSLLSFEFDTCCVCVCSVLCLVCTGVCAP